MFNSTEKKREADKITGSTNTIGKGTIIEGDIETHGNIRIEGKIQGHVKSKSKIVLANGGSIQGDVISGNADIEGEIMGKIEVADTLILKTTAVVHGDIVTSKFIVESGAVFNGGCKMGAPVRDIKLKGNVQKESIFGSKTAAIN